MRERLRCCPGETQPRESRLLLYMQQHSRPGLVLNTGCGRAESFQVLAGDGRHDVLWVVDGNGLKVRVPAYYAITPFLPSPAIHSRQELKLMYAPARRTTRSRTGRRTPFLPWSHSTTLSAEDPRSLRRCSGAGPRRRKKWIPWSWTPRCCPWTRWVASGVGFYMFYMITMD